MAKKNRNIFSMIILITLMFSFIGCTNQTDIPNKEECEERIVSIEETYGLVINGTNGTLMDDIAYKGLKNIWMNKSNENEYLIFITDKDFIWIRVDENGDGYLYGGIYECEGDNIHLILYANNEIVEEHYYEYWIEESGIMLLHLINQDENETIYVVRKAYPIVEEI